MTKIEDETFVALESGMGGIEVPHAMVKKGAEFALIANGPGKVIPGIISGDVLIWKRTDKIENDGYYLVKVDDGYKVIEQYILKRSEEPTAMLVGMLRFIDGRENARVESKK